MTTVINIKTSPNFDPKVNPNDVYIGRFHRSKYGFYPRSKWHNPFKIGEDGTREEVLKMYRNYVLTSSDLLLSLTELKGKRLGCWCKPEACHGDVLAELADRI